ncbi:MAG: hypothetical protein ACKO7B_08505, partial [Flavobacteriales bacterium]
MLFWLDDDLEQGRNHANFKLGSGEELVMYRMEEGKPRIVDRASGFSPVADQTWALIPDGGSQPTFTAGTPGASNTPSAIDHHVVTDLPIFPCPANHYFFWPYQGSAILQDMNGRILTRDIQQGKNDCSHLPSGIYFIKSDCILTRLVVVR